MKCCTFFGHHDCPDSLKEKILAAIRAQITAGTTLFYVGNQGHFDRMALSCLRIIKREYPDLTYAVVLAYLPTEPDWYETDETVLPEGIETVPQTFCHRLPQSLDDRTRRQRDRLCHAFVGRSRQTHQIRRK